MIKEKQIRRLKDLSFVIIQHWNRSWLVVPMEKDILYPQLATLLSESIIKQSKYVQQLDEEKFNILANDVYDFINGYLYPIDRTPTETAVYNKWKPLMEKIS